MKTHLLAGILMGVMALPAHAVTLTIGDKDGGAPGGEPEDAVMPSADLARVTANSGRTMKDTDDGTRNEWVGTTFTLPGPITDGTLTFTVEAVGNFPRTDRILLGFAGPNDTLLEDTLIYDRLMGDSGGDPGVFAAVLGDGTFDTGDVLQDVSLDLKALPLAGGGTLDLIPAINSNGFLDVTLHDDHIVDYVALDVAPVPVPASGLLLLGGLGMAALATRKRVAGRQDA